MSALTGFRISPQQASWWQAQQSLDKPAAALCNQLVISTDTALSTAQLQQRLDQLATEEEILRTRLETLPGMAQPIQVIDDYSSLQIQQQNWSEYSASRQQQALQTLQATAPQAVLAVYLLTISSDVNWLVLQAAPGYLDAHSLQLIAAALQQDLPEAERLQYADYAEWKHELLTDDPEHAGLSYWQTAQQQAPLTQLAGLTQVSDQAFAYASQPLTSDADLSALAAGLNISVAELLYASWAVLLTRLSGHNQLRLNVLYASRGEGIEDALGAYEQALPVAVNLDQSADLQTQLHSLLEARNLATGWCDYYASSQSADFWFASREQLAEAGAVQLLQALPGAFVLGLDCLQLADGSQRLQLCYDSAQLPAAAAGFISEQWQQLLVALSSAESLGSISLCGAQQQSFIRQQYQPAEITAGPVMALIEQHALTAPQSIALHDVNGPVSYQQLQQQSLQLAQHLLQQPGVQPGDTLGILLPRSADAIVAMLAALHAGLSYVPLDPAYPAERIEYMLQDSGARLLISDAQQAAPACEGVSLLDIQQLKQQPADTEVQLPAYDPQRAAYLIYTSGSTGQPKAVAISHSALSQSTQVRSQYYPDRVSAYLLLSSFSFDSSVAGIYWTLIQGGTLVLPQNGEELDLAVLTSLISERQVSHSLSLPSLYETLLDFAPADSLASLRCWVVAGEACNPQVLQKHAAKLPEAKLYNEYGPTEATVWSTVDCLYRAGQQVSTITIGQPVPGSQVHIINEHQQVAAVGETGEIYIAGDTLALGYLNREEQTEQAFVRLPQICGEQRLYRTGDLARWRADGRIDFLGREDHQIKIRGYRIELGEIERELREHSDVGEAVVIAHSAGNGTQLIAYITDQHGYAPEHQALANFLGDRLPDYMVPGRFIHLQQMPHTPNGKVDVNALPDPATAVASVAEYVAPSTPMEQQLCDICCEVLKLEKVGVNDSFFQIGGDSILSLQIVARASQQGIKITAKQVFECETIARLALVATELSAEEQATGANAVAAAAPATEAFELADLDGDDFDNLIAELDAVE